MSTETNVAKGADQRAAAEQAAREAFGRRLRHLMLAAKLNHVSLAKKANLDRSVITRLINGDRRVNGDQVRLIAPALGVTEADLWAASGTIPSDPNHLGNMSDPDRSLAADERNGDEGYKVKYTETDYIARKLDAIEDDGLRAQAMELCSAQIRELLHPTKPSAGKSGHRARGS